AATAPRSNPKDHWTGTHSGYFVACCRSMSCRLGVRPHCGVLDCQPYGAKLWRWPSLKAAGITIGLLSDPTGCSPDAAPRAFKEGFALYTFRWPPRQRLNSRVVPQYFEAPTPTPSGALRIPVRLMPDCQ